MKKIKYESLERVRERFAARAKGWQGRSHIEDVTFATGYAEPGYSDPESGWIAFGNWNTITEYDRENNKFNTVDTSPKEFGETLEKMGVELEWSDEWDTCSDCGKAVRTSPHSYGWTRSYHDFEGDRVCHECIKDDPSEYIDDLAGSTSKAMTIDIDLEEHGFVLLEDHFEHGFHPGQDASPTAIGQSLEDLGVNRFIFVIDDVGQFDMRFSVWVDKDELAELDMSAWESATKDGPSPSAGLQAALRSAAAIPRGDGITVIKCDVSTGTATAKTVSPEDFVEGCALD